MLRDEELRRLLGDAYPRYARRGDPAFWPIAEENLRRQGRSSAEIEAIRMRGSQTRQRFNTHPLAVGVVWSLLAWQYNSLSALSASGFTLPGSPYIHAVIGFALGAVVSYPRYARLRAFADSASRGH